MYKALIITSVAVVCTYIWIDPKPGLFGLGGGGLPASVSVFFYQFVQEIKAVVSHKRTLAPPIQNRG